MALDLPAQAGPARDSAILDRVRAGRFTVNWATVKSHNGLQSGEFRVFADGLKMDGVRINVSATLQQQIADLLGCMLLTARLSDLIWIQRTVTVPPITRSTSDMSSTASMVAESAAVDAQLAQIGNPTGLICTVGKNWILDNDLLDHPGKAINYGWYFQGTDFQGQAWSPCASDPKNCRVIQSKGYAHDAQHTDYSQVCVLVSQRCYVDGQERNLGDVLQNPSTAMLASHQGPLKLLRQPGVAPQPMLVAQQPCIGPNCPEFVNWTTHDATPSNTTLLMIGGGLLVGSFVLGSVLLNRN